MDKRFYILILRVTGDKSIQTMIDEELISLQNDGNIIIDVDVKLERIGYPYTYLGLIKYSYDMKH